MSNEPKTRREVKVFLEFIGDHYDGISLERMQELVAKHPGCRNHAIMVSPGHDDGSIDVELFGWRDETPEEEARRLKEEARDRLWQEERERKKYEELKAKFEGKL